MVIKTKRIKVSPDDFKHLRSEAEMKFGSCCRSAVFDALCLTKARDTERARWLRQTALDKYKGKIITEEKIV